MMDRVKRVLRVLSGVAVGFTVGVLLFADYPLSADEEQEWFLAEAQSSRENRMNHIPGEWGRLVTVQTHPKIRDISYLWFNAMKIRGSSDQLFA